MLGTLVNFISIIIGSIIGLIFKRKLPEKIKITVTQGLGLSVILIGIVNGLKSDSILLVVTSIVIGSIIGEFLKIEDKFEKIGKFIEKKLKNLPDNIVKGFVTASLLYCVGSMAIVGSLESGLTGNHRIIFVKSLLDGLVSIMLASSLGIGVLFSSFIVLIYQGSIVIASSFLKNILIETVVNQMTSVGGILIIGIGINLLEIKKINIGNMIPGIFIPFFYYGLKILIRIVF